MALRLSSLSLIKRHLRVLQPLIRRTYWNKDFKPGPYPRTPEERAAAAKKYGLIPEDYEPYPENVDGPGYGDYPKLPEVSGDARDPYHTWDFPEHKRNFNEPLNAEFDMLGEDRYNANARNNPSGLVMVASFLLVICGTYALYIFCEQHKYIQPLMPKQLPYKGQAHYTFEPLD